MQHGGLSKPPNLQSQQQSNSIAGRQQMDYSQPISKLTRRLQYLRVSGLATSRASSIQGVKR